MKIAILCGGPSLERGISLNSARSVLDHLASENIEIVPFYFDSHKKIYKISNSQLYCNTPSDFDFKLKQTGIPLTQKKFISALKKIDLVFPIIHGAYGEDGGIQSFLEKNNIPFIGSGSVACKKAFDKYSANQTIKKLGFYTLPAALLKIYHNDHKKIIHEFFSRNKIKRAVVKPASGGSSIGVFSVTSEAEALEKANIIFSKRMDTRIILEPFAQGREFTVIILQNNFNLPVAILPTEIEIDYAQNQIFDYRRKYLPTRQVTYHCPPRFNNYTIEKIQVQAEQIFAALKMRDFGRFDGWVFDDGTIWFSDFNPISGMEQNSFLFQQAARVGMTHHDVLNYIMHHALNRYQLSFPKKDLIMLKKRKPVKILFGGNTAERQVSLMSGTNAWLKLCASKKYFPQPYLLTMDKKVWAVPYQLALNHTCEEIIYNCQNAKKDEARLLMLEMRTRLRLGFSDLEKTNVFFQPKKISFEKFINKAKNQFVFIGLHGGFGENGELQQILKKNKVKFNGPDALISHLCMDKNQTKKAILNLSIDGLSVIPGHEYKLTYFNNFKFEQFQQFWKKICQLLQCKSLIIKPNADGCSAGVVHLYSANDLAKYIEILHHRDLRIPKNTLKEQNNIIEMPTELIKSVLIEKYIQTDDIYIKSNRLNYFRKSGWLEITVGFIENNGQIQVFNPSITVAEGEILTVEEKFQGGTGVNITPPPSNIVSAVKLSIAKKNLEVLIKKLGLKGYSRIDAFLHIKTGNLLIIEINTLPGLTPSTVFFHQALAENPSIYPRQLFEKLIENKGY